MQADFEQKVVVISGAGNGMGLALTKRLLGFNAYVAAMDLDTSALQALQHDYPEQLLPLQVDVSDFNAVEQAVKQSVQKFGRIHKLICGAGRLQMGAVTELSPEQWASTFATNTTGVFNLCHLVAPHLIKETQSAIVTISSNAATTPRAGMSAYAASKAAVTQFTRCLALELAEHGVRVNIVSPGSTDTAMQQAMWQQGSSRETVIAGNLDQYRLGIPLRKIATADEIADAVLFLLSEQASHITLHDLRIDGGATLDQ